MVRKEPASAGFLLPEKGMGMWSFPCKSKELTAAGILWGAHNGRYVQWCRAADRVLAATLPLFGYRTPGVWRHSQASLGRCLLLEGANSLAKIRLPCHCKYECHYSEGRTMASINIRIDDELKARAYHELEKLGVTPSELMRQALQYVAERGQLPFRPVLMTEEDEALIATVRERLAAPQRVKVSLDDL